MIMEYKRKTFTKMVQYGDDIMGKPPASEDYLAIKLFNIKKPIKLFEYEICFHIPNNKVRKFLVNTHRPKRWNPRDFNDIELRYVEPYSHTPGISPKQKAIFEKEESTEEFKQKVLNKELVAISNSETNAKWVQTLNSRYYIRIKGGVAEKNNSHYIPCEYRPKDRNNMVTTPIHKSDYLNEEHLFYNKGEYNKGTFCDYPLGIGHDVYLIIYKGFLPRDSEYKDVYKEFETEAEYSFVDESINIFYPIQNERLREKNLKGSGWDNVKFHLLYTYLEQPNFLELRDIVK